MNLGAGGGRGAVGLQAEGVDVTALDISPGCIEVCARGSRERAGEFFSAAGALGTDDVRIVGTMLDPYSTSDPVHLAYHERNRVLGRLGGEVRVRVRYGGSASAWFDLLWASPDELADLCAAHGWTVAGTERSGILYAAELRRS